MGAARKLKGASPKAGGIGKCIVPSILTGRKKQQSKQRKPALAPFPLDCACVPVTLTDGIPVNYDGNVIIVPPPTSGGPWIPAWNPDGTIVWVNAAAIGG
jgi:hypothetical protein